MLCKRLIVCLDVRDGKTTKGVQFLGNKDLGDPVTMAKQYYEAGVDELVFYDITASHEKRGLFLDVLERITRNVFIPFCAGGGIATVEMARKVLLAGAEKVSVNSAVVETPELIRTLARRFGSQCVVLGLDVARNTTMPNGYEVFTHGGRKATGKDALEWVQYAEQLGAGEVVVNSIDADGTQEGYDCEVTGLIHRALRIPTVASGGAGKLDHISTVLAHADAALVASIVHYKTYSIGEIKQHIHEKHIAVRRGINGENCNCDI